MKAAHLISPRFVRRRRRSRIFAAYATAASLLVAAAVRADETTPSAALQQGEFKAALNGLTLWYKVCGQGPVCVMPSPPWGPSVDLYMRTMKSLEKRFTMVYLDVRGTGRSDRATAPTEYTWEHLAADLETLRAHLRQEKIWLAGHSQAGTLAMHYACEHPERVEGMFLIATEARWKKGDEVELLARAMRRKDEPWFYAALSAAVGPRPKTDDELAAQLKAMLPAYWADVTRLDGFAEDFAATSMSIAALEGGMASKRQPFDLTERLKAVTAPAMIIVGAQDDFCPPAAAKAIKEFMPQSKLRVIEDCGHFPWLEQMEQFDEAVSAFLLEVQ